MTRRRIYCIVALAVWLTGTAVFVGLRTEHIYIALLILLLFLAAQSTRQLLVALVPFIVFGISYDWMNIVPNYEVNPVDVEGLYQAEKALFGIRGADGAILTPNEYFALHTHPVLDLLAGVFYLCWVPVPILFGLWLYFSGRRSGYLHFALAFLLANLLGFAVYYIHPAAPPWYVASHGFEAVPGTMGEVAGLGAFDRMTGWPIFDALYARNSNVFAALPSLHSAYPLVGLIYAIRARAGALWVTAFSIISAGIWFTAVYTSHHYVIDVSLGIATALAAWALLEYALMKVPPVRKFINDYAAYISARNYAKQ